MPRPLFIFVLVLLTLAGAPRGALATAQDDMVEFLSRHAALKDDDIDGRMELAKWCSIRDMYPQLAQVAGEVLERQPDNRLAYSYMRQVDEKTELPADPKTESDLKDEFKQHFDHDFSTRATRHFLLVYDTSDQAAARHCFNLEQAYDAFMGFFNLKDVHPMFLERRLVAILFKDRQNYLNYSKEIDGMQMLWSAGYYSQRTNRSAFFDDASSADNEKLQALIADTKMQITTLNRQIDEDYKRGDNADANVLFVQRRDAITKWTIASNMLRATVVGNNTTKTIHEATHELAFNTGIQKRFVDYPFWLSEGLACCFEFEDHIHGMGPASINRGRFAVLRDALKLKSPSKEEELALSLEHLISAGPSKDISDKTLGIYYAHAWALFHYLYRAERPGLEKLLLAYSTHAPMRPISAAEHLKLFTDAFGMDLKTLDRRFLAYIDAVR
jgi:hypothetical protein